MDVWTRSGWGGLPKDRSQDNSIDSGQNYIVRWLSLMRWAPFQAWGKMWSKRTQGAGTFVVLHPWYILSTTTVIMFLWIVHSKIRIQVPVFHEEQKSRTYGLRTQEVKVTVNKSAPPSSPFPPSFPAWSIWRGVSAAVSHGGQGTKRATLTWRFRVPQTALGFCPLGETLLLGSLAAPPLLFVLWTMKWAAFLVQTMPTTYPLHVWGPKQESPFIVSAENLQNHTTARAFSLPNCLLYFASMMESWKT